MAVRKDEKEDKQVFLTMFHQVETFQTQDSWTLDTLGRQSGFIGNRGPEAVRTAAVSARRLKNSWNIRKTVYDECSQYIMSSAMISMARTKAG